MIPTRLPSTAFAAIFYLVLVTAAIGVARARGGSILSAGAELDANSRYLWRGIECDHGPVLQPSASVSAGRATLSAWSSLSSEDSPSKCKEIDLTLQADLGNDLIGIQPSVLYYHYYGVNPSTAEMSVRISRAIGPFQAYTAHTFDVARYGGAYYGETGVDFDGRIHGGPFGLSAALSAAWASRRFNDVYVGASRSALNLASSSIAIRYPAAGRAYVRAHAEGAVVLDRTIRRALPSTPGNAGIAIGLDLERTPS